MPIRYKIDVLLKLKEAGYSSTRIRKEKLIGQSYLQQLHHLHFYLYEVLFLFFCQNH